jgi:hypothetical protein
LVGWLVGWLIDVLDSAEAGQGGGCKIRWLWVGHVQKPKAAKEKEIATSGYLCWNLAWFGFVFA